MKRYERVALRRMTAGFVLATWLALRSDAGNIAEWVLLPWLMVAVALMIGGIAAAKRGWEKDPGKKAVLFFDLNKEVRK